MKCLHPKRGCEAIEDIGIIPRYGGVAVHDCWASYLSYTHCEHALCGAHLLRELTFIVDAHDYAWAKRMKRLLLDACHEVAKRDEKRLSESEYKAVQKRYRTILTQGERELPPIPPRQKGQRGKVAKSDAHNLWERMKKYEKAVLRFAKHPDVAFTNNRAERDLRMSKVKQKVSGCFRTRKYAEAYCRISSYLQSMANQGYNPLVAIQIALAGRAVDNLRQLVDVDHLAVVTERDVPGRGVSQAVDHSEQGGLAGARATDDSDHLAGRNLDRDVVDGSELPESLGKTLDLQHQP